MLQNEQMKIQSVFVTCEDNVNAIEMFLSGLLVIFFQNSCYLLLKIVVRV